jgi:hypothetical protein
VMRNSIDQADEKTPGANKGTLLSGERALPVVEPGLGAKEKQPKRSVASASHSIRHTPLVMARETVAAPKASAPDRPSVEVIEGAKKRNVDFP